MRQPRLGGRAAFFTVFLRDFGGCERVRQTILTSAAMAFGVSCWPMRRPSWW